MLRNRLEEIARVMESSAEYSPVEVQVWRILSSQVDMAHFDRTGQILTNPLTFDVLLSDQVNGTMAPEEVERAINALSERGHLSVVEKRDVSEVNTGTRYRLYLKAADYGS